MSNGHSLYLHPLERGCVVVRSNYSGSPDEIEEFIRQKRACKLRINLPDESRGFPCVTFITKLDIRYIESRNILGIKNAIGAMTILESIVVTYSDSSCDGRPITDAIVTHPNIRKVQIYGLYGGDVGIITKGNPRITSYILGTSIHLGYQYGDILVSATQIVQFQTVDHGVVFRDGDFLRFVRGNPGLRSIGITVLQVSEVVAALGYLNSIEKLRIKCRNQGDTSGLKSAMIGVLMRCHPKTLTVYDSKELFDISTIWPNYHVIHRKNLPRWNYGWSAPMCDVDIHTPDG